MLPPWRKRRFCRFFVFPPWRKRRFCRFLYFRRGGNVVFLIFHSSEASETQFFAFFAHPRPRKRSFSRFSLIRGLGRTKNREIWH